MRKAEGDEIGTACPVLVPPVSGLPRACVFTSWQVWVSQTSLRALIQSNTRSFPPSEEFLAHSQHSFNSGIMASAAPWRGVVGVVT